MLVVLSGTCSALPQINYTWLEENDKYDAIVGISNNKIPICSGILLNKYSVISSANPVFQYGKYGLKGDPELYVHAIAGAYNKTTVHVVESLTYQSRRNYHFHPFGSDKRHSPIHDLVILALWQPMETFTEIIYLAVMASWGDTTTTREVRFPPYQSRHYTMRPIIKVEKFEPKGTFSIAGHGFVDRPHVKQNVDLEVVHYGVQQVLQICDEWIPRIWGRFICLLNIESLVGVTAGGALFYNRRLIGLGAFSVLKGNQSILVFTDLRLYNNMKSWRGYIQLLPDNTSAAFNPDNVTPVKNYLYLTKLALAEGAAVAPDDPVTKEPRYWRFYT